MVSVKDVFGAAMALMDELNAEGNAQTSDTREYEQRTPAIVNMMVAEKRILAGERGTLLPVSNLSDMLINIDDNYALSVMQYGLAANLLIDENPTAAGFYQQRYEELRDRFMLRQQAAQGVVEDLYGGIEYGQFARW